MSGLFKEKQLLMIDRKLIKAPRLVRQVLDKDELAKLVESIRVNGIIQPLAVRRCKDDKKLYELIAGQRRLKAASLLNIEKVPCIVLQTDDCQSHIAALIENLQRQELSYFEQADGIYALINKWGLTQHQAAQRLGFAQSTVANKLRLLKLTPAQRESLQNMQLTERHARSLLRIEDVKLRDVALNEVIVKGYTVEDTERMVDRLLSPPEKNVKKPLIVRDIRLFINSINRAIDVMKMSGVRATSKRSETEQYIQYTVTIPKQCNEIEDAAI
ncbi:MAG: ParB/RepB/Spo0J family partition protein [Clostridia bacterium]|nr:ParB/RepB/Spo0J family partition protein [Clostridia bacterium]